MIGTIIYDKTDFVLGISQELGAWLGIETVDESPRPWETLIEGDSASFKPPLGELWSRKARLKRADGSSAEGVFRIQAIASHASFYLAEVRIEQAGETCDSGSDELRDSVRKLSAQVDRLAEGPLDAITRCRLSDLQAGFRKLEDRIGIQAEKSCCAKSQPGVSEKRILIVEDNVLNADMMDHFLRECGVSHDIARNGFEALDMYEDGKYDLVFMDVMMPEMDGCEATEKLLAASSRQPTLPVVGVTARILNSDRARCLDSGMVEVLQKPVDLEILCDVLNRRLASPLPEQKNSIWEGIVNIRVLDEYLRRMSSDGKSCREVLDTALEVLESDVEKICEAIDSRSWSQTSLLAHSLKGALGLLGARVAYDVASSLEIRTSFSPESTGLESWQRLIRVACQEYREAAVAYLDSRH